MTIPAPKLPRGFHIYPELYSMSAYFTLVGASLILSGFELVVSDVQRLPAPLVAGWALLLILGGPAIVVGLRWRGSDMLGRALQRAGLMMAAAAWATYVLTMLKVSPGSLLAIGQGLTFTAMCVGRTLGLYRVDRTVEHIEAVARDASET